MTAKRKHKIVPPNNQHVLSDCWSNQDDCKGAKAPVIKNVHGRHHRECNGQKYVMLQGATMTNDGWLQQRCTCQATTNQIFSCITGASNNCKMTSMSTQWQFLCPMSYCKKLRWRQQQLIATSAQDCLSDNLPYDWYGLTTLMIVKAWNASNEIDCDATTTMLTTRQSFWDCIARNNDNKTTNSREGQVWLPRNNQNIMLLFARCKGDRTAQCKDQWRKYAEVEYSKYAKEDVRAHQRRCVHCQGHVHFQRQVHWVCQRWNVHCRKRAQWECCTACMFLRASTLSTPKTTCTLPRASMASMPKEVAFIKEGHNEPLVKEGNNKTLAKDGNWLSTTMSPLPQGQLAMYVMRGGHKHLATRTGDCVHHARWQRAALGLHTPCKATTSPSPQQVTEPQPSKIMKAPKR